MSIQAPERIPTRDVIRNMLGVKPRVIETASCDHNWGAWVMCTHRGHTQNFTCTVRTCNRCYAEEHRN